MMTNKEEERVQRFWEENEIYKKAKEKRMGGKPFFFMDGPPYATGRIHLGTAWNKILKDVYIRYFRMCGYDVYDRPGYDVHGVPIENKVEKKLGISGKREIEEKIGVEEFVEMCREFATEHIEVMNEQFKNLGVWMDWDDYYVTMDREYINAAWWTFKKAEERGLLYKDKYPVHVCPHCGTVVSFAEIEYKDLEDPSIYVAFPAENGDFLLIWTTTPWTLPANVAVMVHPKETYVRVKVKDKTYILAKARLEEVAKEVGWKEYEVLGELPGEELVGLRYESPLKEEVPVQGEIEHRVVPSERFVTMEEGTGLVHSAPGHGREDYIVGKEFGLPVLSPVGIDGVFTEEAGKYAGMYVKEADKHIIEDLRRKGYLVHEGRIVHSYPICWRCKNPLLFISVDEWFYAVERIKDKLYEENEKVYWYPPWAKERFADWIRNLRDWPVSRQRYWGTPVPIWICESCGYQEVIGSLEELEEKSGRKVEDPHRPWIDEVTYPCPKCGGTMRRVPDVLDVWFDSGITTWAVLGYPKNKELFDQYWPADLEIEGVDQIRGWWNSQMITSVIVFDRAPYKRVTMHGFVLDVHGLKMSKSLGNVVTPEEVIEKYSRDVLRFYLLSQPLGEDINFDWEKVKEAYRELNVIWNLHLLLKRFIDQERPDLEAGMTSYQAPEDRWILSRLHSVLGEVHELFEKLQHFKALRLLSNFLVEEVSKTYVKMVRERMKGGRKDPSREAVYQTLYHIMKETIPALAPFIPHMAEVMYQNVLRRYLKEESVHLLDYPKPKKHLIDGELEEKMKTVLSAAEAVLALRHEAGIRLRWPIRDVWVDGPSEPFETFKEAFLRYVNAKELRFGKKEDYISREFEGGTVYISSRLDEELLTEALAREVLRRVQQMRKEMKLVERDRVVAELWADEELRKAVEKHRELITNRAGIEELLISETETLDGYKKEFDVEGYYLRVTLKKI